MPKPSKPEPPRITDRAEYVDALAKLDRVNMGLEAASRHLEAVSRGRRTEVVGRFLARARSVFVPGFDQTFEKAALRVAAEGEIGEQVAKTLSIIAAEIPSTLDQYDRETVEAIDEAERRLKIFQRASALQQQRILAEKKIALAEVCNASRGERERIAREVAGLALDLVRAASEENAFLERLRAQDESLPAMLGPGPFPIALHPESPVYAWLALTLGISDAAVQTLVKNPQLVEGGRPSPALTRKAIQ